MKRYSAAFILLIFIMWLLNSSSVFGIRSGYEQIKYSVIERIGDVEIRKYPFRIVAEVHDAKDDNEAFMLLFHYISGENSANTNVAMTTPVQVDKASMKIPMTTPVETSTFSDSRVSMRFFLPSSLRLDSAPKPNDSRIKILGLPEETFAVLTYSGSGSHERFRSKSNELLNILSGSHWQPILPPSFLGYDPPFTIPFLRRNEVIVKVEASQR